MRLLPACLVLTQTTLMGIGCDVSCGTEAVLRAQNAEPRFEAVSIKPHNPAIDSVSAGRIGSEWTASGANLLMLLKDAFPEFAEDGRLVGVAGWMVESRFDLRAKATSTITYPTATTMIRNMVIDRFAVRSHVEPRPLNVYVARLVDGKPGPWLRPTPPDCVAARSAGQPRPPTCERLAREREAKGERALTLTASTLPRIFATLRQLGGFDRIVVDRTGLTGLYDASIKYDVANPVDANDGATSSVTAARDQLGVTFEPGRETLDVLVIDSAKMPEPD